MFPPLGLPDANHRSPLTNGLWRDATAAPSNPRFVVPGLIALAALPVAFIVLHTLLLVTRNVAYWDEIDTVLDFLLKLKTSATWHDALAQIVSLGNEHRTVTSRLLFAASYWLTGTVNFTFIGIIGNLFLFGAGAILIARAGTTVRKLQLAVILSFLLFQLQHFENFFWSGSSIDHFQIVMLAAATFAALASGTRAGVWLAGITGCLATFTLAHGILVWPVGALALAVERRWRHLAAWSAVAALSLGGFFAGFAFNTGHAIGDLSAAGLGRVAHYWLKLLGAPLALGNDTLAPFLGATFLVLFGTQLRGKILARERIVLPLAVWAVGALLLVAVGRVDVVGGHVHSRYYVLSCLAWALVAFVLLNGWHDSARPYRALFRALPVLIGFNLAANLSSANDARSWTICRNSALENYLYYGRDGMGPFSLHPAPDYTMLITRKVEEQGIYRMPGLCQQRWFPDARLVGDISYFVDRIPVNDTLAAIEGWAGIPGREAKQGQIHVILQSSKSRYIFTTLPVERPDVSLAYPGEKWRHTGFRFQRRRWLLPPEIFQIGLLIQSPRGTEFIMTAHRLDLSGPGEGILAAAE